MKATRQGQSVSVVPISTEMTTPAAAKLLGCSRPHFAKLLEEGNIPFTSVRRHPRVKHEDIMDFQKAMKLQRE